MDSIDAAPQFNIDIAHEMALFGWETFVVGGFVRDGLMGREAKDIDILVTGVDWHVLVKFLKDRNLNPHGVLGGAVDFEGRIFDEAPVVMIHPPEIDAQEWSIPRVEVSTGRHKNDFQFEAGAHISIFEDSLRRDFTSGAILLNLVTGEMIDLHEGKADISQGKLDFIDKDNFPQSPDRFIRAFAFITRFGWEPSSRLVNICWEHRDKFSAIHPNQVGMLFRKAFSEKDVDIHAGFSFLIETGWIDRFPGIANLIDCKQDAEWHPEGDAFVHTMLVAQIAHDFGATPDERFMFTMAGLCHDMGKPLTTTHDDDGRIRSKGHDEAGVPVARQFCEQMGSALDTKETLWVETMTREHMFPATVAGTSAVRRLAQRLGDAGTVGNKRLSKKFNDVATIRQLSILMEADARGIGGGQRHKGAERMVAMAEAMKVVDSQPLPIVTGKHLITLGMKPGRKFGTIKRAAFEAQLEGKFDDVEGGIEWLVEGGHVELSIACISWVAYWPKFPVHICRHDTDTSLCGIEMMSTEIRKGDWFSCKRCIKTEVGKLLSAFFVKG